jgi:beta-mannanase
VSQGTTPIVNAFGRLNNTDYPGHAAVIAGTYDSQISAWAQALQAVAGPVWLRPLREMNGSWAPWFTTDYASFIGAWRHIRGLFAANSNVKFVWCPATNGNDAYGNWYPGDAFVDICGIDGYARIAKWRSFYDLFSPFYLRCNSMSGTICKKPTMVCETNAEVSSDQSTYNRSAWFDGIVPTLNASFPLLQNVCMWVDNTFPDFGAPGSDRYITMANDTCMSAA